MIIKSIDLQNIRSHKFTHIDFKNGITVITGDVGSGKTTILESIKFALFGGSSLDYKNLLRIGEDSGSVSLEMEHENENIRITRKLKKTRDGFSGNDVTVTINGKSKDLNDKEMKKLIAKIFKVNQYKKKDPIFFKTVIYASQEEMKSIMAMNPDERREIVLDLFQITSLKRILENVEILKEHILSKVEISKAIIGENGEKINDEKEKIYKLNENLNDLKKKIKEYELIYKIKENELKNVENELKVMENLKKEKDNLENEIKIENERYKNFKKDYEKNLKKLNEIENKKEDLLLLKEKDKMYHELDKKIDEAHVKQEKYNNLILNMGVQENELKNLVNKKNDLDKYKKEINEIEQKINEIILDEIDNTNINEEYSKFKFEIENEKKEIVKIKKEIDDLKDLKNLVICPKCKRPLDQEHINSLIQDDIKIINEKNERIENLEKNLKIIEKLISENNEKLKRNMEKEKYKLNLQNKKLLLESQLVNEDKIYDGIKEIEDRINFLKKELEKISFNKEDMEKLMIEKNELEKYHNEYIRIENEINMENEIKNENKRIEDEMKKLEESIKSLQENVKNINFNEDKYINFKEKILEINRETGEIKSNLLNSKNNLKEKMEEINNEERNLKYLLDEEKKIINDLKFLDWIDNIFVKDIDKIISNRINSIRIEFESEINDWFKILLPGSEMEISIDRDFSLIITVGDFEMDYSSLSGGESNAVAFSYRLALNSMLKKFNLIETNFVMLDEPTDGFSDKQIQQMQDIFSNINVDQVIIVTHENMLENFADNSIKITKENGISRI
mgnify:CR=1 FL=1